MSESNQRLNPVLVSPALRHGFFLLGAMDVSIGRSPGCHVVLPADDVSRVHAKICCTEGLKHTITDMKSCNGTWVNGERVLATRSLEPGDEVAIGSAVLTYLVVEGTRDELAARFDHQPETPARPIPRSVVRPPLLAGTIAAEMLIEACQLVELNRHSGVVRVESDGLLGILRFREGTIVGAVLGEAQGEPAARRILALRRGRYVFDEAETEADAAVYGIAVRSSVIALDVVRMRDELEEEGNTTRHR